MDPTDTLDTYDTGLWGFFDYEAAQPYSRYHPREQDLRRFYREEISDEQTNIDILRHILHCYGCEEYVLRGISKEFGTLSKASVDEYLEYRARRHGNP